MDMYVRKGRKIIKKEYAYTQCKTTLKNAKDINKQHLEMVWVDWQRCITVGLVTDANNL